MKVVVHTMHLRLKGFQIVLEFFEDLESVSNVHPNVEEFALMYDAKQITF